eukprot:390197_1
MTDYSILLSERIITSLCLCHNTGLLVHKLWKLRSNKNEFSNPLFLWTNIILLSFTIFNLICFLSTFAEYLRIDCLYWYLMILSTYYLSKYFIWKHSLIRVQVLSKNAYSEKCLFYLSCTFIIIALSLITFTVFTMNHFKITKHKSYCPSNVPFWFYMLLGIIESALFIYCCWLFYSKLNSLNESRTTKNFQMLYLLRKLVVLTCVLIASTWIRVLFSSFSLSIQGISCVDSVVNCWCMLLVDARYDNIYLAICKCVAKPEWNEQQQVNVYPHQLNSKSEIKPVVDNVHKRLSLKKQLSNKSNVSKKNSNLSIGLVPSKLKLKTAASAPVPTIHKTLNSYTIE